MRARMLVPLVAVGMAACVGSVDRGPGAEGQAPGVQPGVSGPGPGGGGGTSVPVSGTPGAPGTGKTYTALRPVPASAVRLTQAQYANSVTDVFGADVKVTAPLDPDETTELFSSIGAAKVGTSDRGVEQYRDAAFEVVGQVWKKKAQVPALAACNPQSATDPCIAAAIKSIGLRLWRRPLTADEVARYAQIVGADGATADKLATGMQYALAGLLQSPNFLYRIQVGEKDPAAGGALRFTGYEMASRLSYFLWDSTPDQELLDAAEQLVNPDMVAAQLKRMLGKPRARGVATRFFSEGWKVAHLDEPDKNKATFPLWNATLLNGYREEFRRVLEDVVFDRPGDVRDVFDGRETFVNKDTAKVYGMTGINSADFVRAPLDERRAGLFTSGAAMAANSPSDRSSPTHRGVFVMERVLCVDIPPPPNNVDTSLLNDPKKGATFPTVRAKLDAHRQDPACAGCHGLFDPLGYTFENFDGIGAYRTTENGVAIDSSGKMGDQTFKNARELAGAVRNDPRATRCLAQQLFGYAVGHEATDGEKGVVDALADTLASAKYDFQQLVLATATSAGFRYLAAAP